MHACVMHLTHDMIYTSVPHGSLAQFGVASPPDGKPAGTDANHGSHKQADPSSGNQGANHAQDTTGQLKAGQPAPANNANGKKPV